MTGISNVDRLVLLLRQRLEASSASGTSKRSQARSARAEPQGVKALAAIEGVDDRQFRRALIQNLLADHFGSELINEAKFQQVVEQVTETLEQDPSTAALVERLVGELRAQAR